MEEIGFIILRHVNSQLTDNYWKFSYLKIRENYPEFPIVIIDDNSNKEFLTQMELYKTTIIESEFPGRGELLPYYYYSRNKFFEKAIIIHDSVFIMKKIPLHFINYKILWNFDHEHDQPEDQMKMIEVFNDSELKEFYLDYSKWKGCFGCMTMISYDFLQKVNQKYDFSLLIDLITCRYNRCSFERVIGCILQKEYYFTTLFGNYYIYLSGFAPSFDQINLVKHLPVIKVFTGR